MLVFAVVIQICICSVAHAEHTSRFAGEENYAEFIRTRFPSTNDYLRQDTNTIIEMKLEIVDKGANVECMLNDFWKLQTDFCHPIFLQFHYNADLKFIESICVVQNHTKSHGTYNISMLIFIPQYRLYWQNAYNNMDDFKYGMEVIITNKISLKNKWQTKIISTRIRQLGRVISGYMIDAEVNCTQKQTYCQGQRIKMTPEDVFKYGLAFCEKVLKLIEKNNSALASVFDGCWTWVKSHDDQKTSVRQYLFFSSMLRVERNLTGWFHKKVKKALPERESEIFSKLDPVMNDYEDDTIRVPFVGNLRKDGAAAQWDDDYRLTFSSLYFYTFENVTNQMTKQIRIGDESLVRPYGGYKFQKIFFRDNKTRIRGSALYLIGEINHPKEKRYEIASAVQVALNQHFGKNKNEFINDIHVTHGLLVRYTLRFEPKLGEDALNEQEEKRSLTMCRDVKRCIDEYKEDLKCDVVSYRRDGRRIVATVDFNLLYGKEFIFENILQNKTTSTRWLESTFNSGCTRSKNWSIKYEPEPSMWSRFLNIDGWSKK